MSPNGILELDGRSLDLAVLRVFDAQRPAARISKDARSRMQESAAQVRRIVASDEVCYGINTGFGAFANRRISAEATEQLQYNLVRSHTCGVGAPLAPAIVRRIMLLKANSLAAGYSGIRPEVVDVLLALLEADVLPIIPAQGSVSASGDLAPLAHLAMALIGEGEAMQGERRLENEEVLKAAGQEPVRLQAKEGLALLNGTQVSGALAMEGLFRAENLLDVSIVCGALSVDAIAGSYSPFDERIHAARGMRGQAVVAAALRSLLTESAMHMSHVDCERVQDPYAVRCMPQVFGAVLDTINHGRAVLGCECNGVSDNPLVFGEDVLSGGNFHAEPIGFVSDFLAIAVAELGNISERRTDLLERRVNPNLNLFLTGTPGLESGFMIAQVTAAALASENKTYAHPASVDSIPTSAGQEDHVSMAAWAGMKLARICDNVELILAIELLAAAHALDYQEPLATTEPLQAVLASVRALVPKRADDHRLDKEIEALAIAIRTGAIAAHLPLREATATVTS